MANVKTGIAKVNNAATKATGLKGLLMSMQGQIAKALPTVLTPERYTRMVMTALSTNPQLQQCTPESFAGAFMTSAQLGLEPNTPLGHAYFIPYRNRGRLECQFQIGYKGYLDLAYRSGEISVIDAQVVHENDDFEFEYGLDPKLKFKPKLANRGPVIAYYAMFKTKDGGFNFFVMSKEDVEQFAKQYSKAAGSGYSPWSTNFDSMAKKTVLKQLLKYAPLKSDFIRAISADETIKTNIGKDMLDEPDETEPIDVTPEPVEDAGGEGQNELPFAED